MEIKEKLVDALKEAVAKYNDGTEPTAAVIKTALDHSFNPEQAVRLAEMFNNARTIYHYKHASDRTAQFDLADTRLVELGLFSGVPDEAKKAQVDTYSHDYASYDTPERDYTKQADVQVEFVAREYGETIESITHSAMRAIYDQRDMAKTAADESRLCGVAANAKLVTLANYIGRNYAEVGQEKYAKLIALHSNQPDFQPVFDALKIHVAAPYVPSAEKLASMPAVIDASDILPLVDMLKEAKYWLEEEANMAAMAGQFEKDASDFEREFTVMVASEFTTEKQAQETLGDFLSDAVLVKLAAPPDSISRPSKPSSGGGSKGFPSLFADSLFGGFNDSIKKQVSTGMDSVLTKSRTREMKSLSERLRNAQRQVMLEDLITTDPVLSKEDPEVVAQAYSSLMQLTPDTSMHKEVVRAILRQSVHQLATGPYEAHAWTQLEKNLRQVTGKQPMDGKDEAVKR